MKIPQPLCENISSVGGWLAPTVPAPGGRQGNTGRGPNTGKENTLITGWGDASLFHIKCKEEKFWYKHQVVFIGVHCTKVLISLHDCDNDKGKGNSKNL